VWLLSALLLVVASLWITTTQKAPTLPVGLAQTVVVSTLVG